MYECKYEWEKHVEACAHVELYKYTYEPQHIVMVVEACWSMLKYVEACQTAKAGSRLNEVMASLYAGGGGLPTHPDNLMDRKM